MKTEEIKKAESELKELEKDFAKKQKILKTILEREEKRKASAEARRRRSHHIYTWGAMFPQVLTPALFDRCAENEEIKKFFFIKIQNATTELKQHLESQRNA